MDDSTTHIASLVFARPPDINFAACVAEMDQSLRDAWYISYNLHWDHEDLVIFNIDSSRVVLAYGEYPAPDSLGAHLLADRADPFGPSPLAACLMISIGPGPMIGCPTRVANHAEALLQVIADRFQAAFRCDLLVWSVMEAVFIPEDFDSILIRSIDALASDRKDLRGRLAPTHPAPRLHRFDTPDVERLMMRLERHIPLRSRPLPQPPSITLPPPSAAPMSIAPPIRHRPIPEFRPHEQDFANSLPPQAHPMINEMRAIRNALYPEKRRPRSSRGPAPLPQRLTVYTLNTTLMLVALPVGSAILVYNLLRGEDLKFSTRAIAFSSTVIGFAQVLGLDNMLPLI